jgi:hypothetical protein
MTPVHLHTDDGSDVCFIKEHVAYISNVKEGVLVCTLIGVVKVRETYKKALKAFGVEEPKS